jgi:hypothetical protein
LDEDAAPVSCGGGGCAAASATHGDGRACTRARAGWEPRVHVPRNGPEVREAEVVVLRHVRADRAVKQGRVRVVCANVPRGPPHQVWRGIAVTSARAVVAVAYATRSPLLMQVRKQLPVLLRLRS